MIGTTSDDGMPRPLLPGDWEVAWDGLKNCILFKDQPLLPNADEGVDTCVVVAGILMEPRFDDIVGELSCGRLIDDNPDGKENALADTIISPVITSDIVMTIAFLTLPPSSQYVVAVIGPSDQ
jgi:hypothetical protein